jgi:23S rRNA pseudouridine1911/1915/1917 synthase
MGHSQISYFCSFKDNSLVPIAMNVLYEDNHLLVLNKPANCIVQGAQPDQPSLLDEAKEYIRIKYKKPGAVYLGVVSRLDRCVTGVVPLARTSKSAARLSEQFREREVAKTYVALVQGRPRAMALQLKHWLLRDESMTKTRWMDHEIPNAQLGILSYRVIGSCDQWSQLEIVLETGRKHQIRAQMEAIHCPILGDRKYGSAVTFPSGIALHCSSVTIDHPITKVRQEFKAPLPECWQRYTDRT